MDLSSNEEQSCSLSHRRDVELEHDTAMATLSAVEDAGIYFYDDMEDDDMRIGQEGVSSSSLGKRKLDVSVHSNPSEASNDTADPPQAAYPYEIYKACFLALHNHDASSIPTLNIDIVRLETQAVLATDVVVAVEDEVLKKMMEDYVVTLQQKEKRSVTTSILKYSRKETDIIIGAVKSFLRDYSLSPEDVCPSLRSSGDHLKGAKKDLTRKLFDDLQLMLPYRHRDTIKYFIERKLFLMAQPSHSKGRWTNQDKERLLELHEKFGSKWAKLGRELGKRPEDVRIIFKQLKSVKKGKYSAEEEQQLIEAIRQSLGLVDTPVNELPSLGIKWQSVAQLMHHERTSVEYQIKWGHLRQRLVFGRHSVANEEDVVQCDLKILEAIGLQLAENASDVNWNEISRKCSVGPGHADSRWRIMNKRFPAKDASISFHSYVAYLTAEYQRLASEELASATAPVQTQSEAEVSASPTIH